MPILFPRIRLINFRLSEDEYLVLERLCAASNSRSISDFVRKAIQIHLAGTNLEALSGSNDINYAAHLKQLEMKVEGLAARVSKLRPGA